MNEYNASNSTPETEIKESEDQIVKRILALKDTYEQSSKDTRQEIGEIYSSYMGKMDEVQSTPYDTKDSIPKLRTEIAYIKPFIFSGEPVVEFEGVGDEDKAISKIYEKIVNHRFQTIPNFYEKIESWVSQGVGFGTSIIKVVWRFKTKEEEGERMIPDSETGEMIPEKYKYETPVQDEPDVEVPNILDVYYNPIIADLNDQPCLIFRAVLPIEVVKGNPAYNYINEEGNRNADELEQSANSKNSYDSSSLMKTDIPAAQQKATEGMVEIFELIDDDKIQTIGNGKLLRDEENAYGFKNAVKFIFEPNVIPNRANGLGVGQNTHGLGKMFYKLFNQGSTNVKMVNNPMSAGEKGLNIDKRQLVSKPGGHVELDLQGRPINEVFQWQQIPDLNTGFMEMLNKVDDEHKRASGANDLVQGAASNDTLGQDEIAQANTSNRLELVVRRFKVCLAEVAQMILKMELQNLQSPDADILRIFPEEMRQQIYDILINEKDNVKYNVRIKGETNVARNKNLESKRQVELFNLGAAFLLDKEKRAFMRRIAELQGIDNIDEIIGEVNPVMEQQEQLQMQQGQMQEQQTEMMMQNPGGVNPMQSGVGDNLAQQAV